MHDLKDIYIFWKRYNLQCETIKYPIKNALHRSTPLFLHAYITIRNIAAFLCGLIITITNPTHPPLPRRQPQINLHSNRMH